MIRVVCVINELDLGGAERLLVDQIGHSNGIDFHVCLLTGARSVLASRLPDGVPVHDLGAARRWDPRTVTRLRAVIKEVRPAVVHAHLPRSGAISALATRGTGRPLVYTEHSVWSAYAPITQVLALTSARAATAVVGVSDRVRASCQRHARLPDSRIRTIRNGVDLERLAHATAHQTVGRLRLCAVGNLLQVKGYPHLLRALAATGPGVDISLDVFGSGPERAALEALVDDLGLTGSVRLLGQQLDAASRLADYDAYCLPSLIEGLPMALIEAMATGLPVVATAVGGIPEVIRSGDNGLLVPPADAKALATALRQLALDPQLSARLGANARETAMRDLSIVECARSYAQLYQEIA